MSFETKKRSNDGRSNATFALGTFEVRNVRQLSEKCLTFTLRLPGLSLYNMRLIDGKKGNFITNGQSLGNDGKWYNNFSLYLSDEDTQKLIDAVMSEYEKSE